MSPTKKPCESCGSTVWGAHHAHCEKAGKKILEADVSRDDQGGVEIEVKPPPDPPVRFDGDRVGQMLVIEQTDQDIEIDTMRGLLAVMEDAFRRGLGYKQADRVARWFSERYEEE